MQEKCDVTREVFTSPFTFLPTSIPLRNSVRPRGVFLMEVSRVSTTAKQQADSSTAAPHTVPEQGREGGREGGVKRLSRRR